MIVTEGTIGTLRFNFHFVTHVTTSGHSVPSFIVKLNELKVVAKGQ